MNCAGVKKLFLSRHHLSDIVLGLAECIEGCRHTQTHTYTHIQPEEKRPHGWIQVPKRLREWSVQYTKSGWPVDGGF